MSAGLPFPAFGERIKSACGGLMECVPQTPYAEDVSPDFVENQQTPLHTSRFALFSARLYQG